MKKTYDRILEMRGNLLTVIAKGVALGEIATIYKKSGEEVLASVLRIEGERVTAADAGDVLDDLLQIGGIKRCEFYVAAAGADSGEHLSGIVAD